MVSLPKQIPYGYILLPIGCQGVIAPGCIGFGPIQMAALRAPFGVAGIVGDRQGRKATGIVLPLVLALPTLAIFKCRHRSQRRRYAIDPRLQLVTAIAEWAQWTGYSHGLNASGI